LTDATLDARNDAAPRHQEAGIGDYWALLKPRVMSLVVFTALVGLILAPGDLHWVKGVVAILCIAIGAGASGALNQWYDADIDAVMARTAGRPVPAGRISPDAALEFGMVLSFFSVAAMAVLVGYVPAALLAFTIFFYAVVYTMWLKRWTAQNIVIGGASGALPPVIAWSAVTGTVDLYPMILFAIIFLWTPAHFWALALVKNEDYTRAKVPMLPVVAGAKATKRQIVVYAVLTAAAAIAPFALGFAGVAYATVAVVLSLGFVALSVRLWRTVEGSERKPALQLFAYSIAYLFALFFMAGLERLIVGGA
jgi:protoheme IX farnesyltransferase